MAAELKVPTLGMDMDEATILRWLVEEGTEVEKGDPVLEIETDKTSFEIEASADGQIRNLRGEEGETLPVGAVLAHIVAPGEEVPEKEPEQEHPETDDGDGARAARPDGSGSRGSVVRSRPEPDGVERHRVRASPAARRAAQEREVEFEDIAGSGPNGRVYLSDVLEAESGLRDSGTGEPPAPAPPSATTHTSHREALSRIRRVGGERTARSFRDVPHFYLTRDVEADRLMELRERLREKMEPAPNITELLALATARILKEHPRLNARYAGGELEMHEQVNLGLAVATDDGLVVPVLKGADTLSLRELVPLVKDLIRRSRSGKLDPGELSEGTFTISNLGMMGVDSFDAVINTPEAAILAVGKARTVPKWHEGEWLPQVVITMTLSVDHRVADGADGARFLGDLQNALTNWELLL